MIGRSEETQACVLRTRWQAAILLLLMGASATRTTADEVAVAESDRLRATQLAEQAAEADQSGDSRESRGLLLRAVRWETTRHRDYQQAIDSLSLTDRPASLRHAQIALRRDSDFGEDAPTLLLRLVTTASEDEAWSTAAAVARRHRYVVFGQPSVSRRRKAEIELSVSRLEFLAGENERASDGFDRLHRLRYGLPISEPIAGLPVPWQFVASCHLAAKHPDRAEDAITLLSRRSGETAEVELLRARLALARGEPLAAIEHATRAVESPNEASTADGYGVLIAAFVGANQTAQASDWLQAATEREPDAVAPSLALVETLTLLGKDREAWIESQRLVTRLLDATDPFDPLFGEIASNREAAERRIDLAIAAEQGVATSINSGEVDSCLETLPSLAARLNGIDPIATALDPVLLSDAVSGWLKTVSKSKNSSATKAAAGTRRAAAALALRLGEMKTYEALVRSRVEEALGDSVDLSRVEHEVVIAATAMAEHSTERGSQQFLEWAITQTSDAAESRGEDAGALLANLRLQLAEAIARHLPDDPAKKRQAVDQAVDLLRGVRDEASRDSGIDHAELFVFLRCGLHERAIEAGERVWLAGPPAKRGAIDATRHRDTGLLLEEALAKRSTPGDLARRVEVLEAILDAWPDHAVTLLRLAAAFTEQGQHLSRAERMARRVIQVEPEWPAALASLGGIRYRLGDEAEAVSLLQQAVAAIDAGAEIETGEESSIRDRYAELLAKLGRAEQAAVESSE